MSEVEELRAEVERLREQNAELVNVVIDQCIQGCYIDEQYDDGCLIDNMALGTYEYTLHMLEQMGYAKDTTGDGRFYRVWWKKQEASS